MHFELLHPREQLIHIMDRIYRYGLTTTSGGNLSVLEEDGTLWITPSAVDKGSLRATDIMRIDPDGRAHGPHQPSSELPFHQMIYARRPDVRAIVHAHSPYLMSFSIARRIPDTRIIPQAHHVCGMVGYAPYALPGSKQLGEVIADTFTQGYDVVLLENHGVVTAGPDLLTAFQRLETLDFCAKTQIMAGRLGPVYILTDEQIARFEAPPPPLPTFTPARPSSRERELRAEICRFVHRAYEQRLMTSTEGTMSARLGEDAFLITPYGIDRRYIDVEDIVLVQDGQAEKGKRPSRAVNLHRRIYADHPEVACIVTAQSPHAMAFAVTRRPLDTKTIPESYVVLRDVPMVPHGRVYLAPETISAAITPHSPTLLIENDTVLATGKNIHQAFDRLEVVDFTAMAILNALAIGPIISIGEGEILELERHFA
ncbi:MAG: class II aldolase/adducin family protein [Anaerolineae bacterium]